MGVGAENLVAVVVVVALGGDGDGGLALGNADDIALGIDDSYAGIASGVGKHDVVLGGGVDL